MKNFFSLFLILILLSCSSKQGVYWCGDHPCLNKKEKEAYFKKTMIVEVKNLKESKIKKSEIEKVIQQAKLNEKQRIKDEKYLAKQNKLKEKKRIKDEKDFIKQTKLNEKQRIKEEKKLAKQAKLKEKGRIKKNKELDKQVKLNKKTKQISVVKDKNILQETKSTKFRELVDILNKRNSLKSYPDINKMPN